MYLTEIYWVEAFIIASFSDAHALQQQHGYLNKESTHHVGHRNRHNRDSNAQNNQSSKQGITKVHALQQQTWAPQPRVCTSCWSQSHRNRQNIGRQHPAPTGNSNQGN